MHATVLEVEVRIPQAQSLKGKRKVLRRLLARLSSDQVAVTEAGLQDTWQRSVIGIGLVSGSEHRLREMTQDVRRILVDDPEIEVVEIREGRLEAE